MGRAVQRVLAHALLPLYLAVFVVGGSAATAAQVAARVLLGLLAPALADDATTGGAAAVWGLLVWLVEGWGNVVVRVHLHQGEDAGFEDTFGKESAVILLNHSSDVDFILGWAVAARVGCLGRIKALAKSSLRYTPVLGWQWALTGTCFLRRKWAHDACTLSRACEGWARTPQFWLTMFVEGTRFTPAKHARFWAGCDRPLRHLLPPRTNGFREIAGALPSTPVYTAALSYRAGKRPDMLSILSRERREVDVCLRRHAPGDVPSGEDAEVWLKERWAELDDHLEDCRRRGAPPPPYAEAHRAPAAWPGASMAAAVAASAAVHRLAAAALPPAVLRLACAAVGLGFVALAALALHLMDSQNSTTFENRGGSSPVDSPTRRRTSRPSDATPAAAAS